MEKLIRRGPCPGGKRGSTPQAGVLPLSAVKATYDEYEEGWRVKTRTLGKYLISDVELKTSVPTVTPGEDADDTVDGTVEPTVPSNPSTGARA